MFHRPPEPAADRAHLGTDASPASVRFGAGLRRSQRPRPAAAGSVVGSDGGQGGTGHGSTGGQEHTESAGTGHGDTVALKENHVLARQRGRPPGGHISGGASSGSRADRIGQRHDGHGMARQSGREVLSRLLQASLLPATLYFL